MSWYHSRRGYPVVYIDALVLGHADIEEPSTVEYSTELSKYPFQGTEDSAELCVW